MAIKKFLIESKNIEGDILFGYNEDGLLVYLEIKGNVPKLYIIWLHRNLGPHYKGFQEFKKNVEKSGSKICEVMPDLSFEFFWLTYDYKKGKKSTVKRKWDGIPDPERVKALAYIKKYNHYLSMNDHIQRQYPQSYLSRAEWRN